MGRGDRICYRLKRKFPVVYQPVESAKSFYTVSTDVSTTGIGIRAERQLEKDILLDLEIYLPGRLPKLPLRGRVMFQKPILHRRKQFYLTGIRFESPSEEATLALTRFIARNLRMAWLRTSVLVLGGIAAAANICRAFFFTTMGLFRGTAFGKEWMDVPWYSLPITGLAAVHAAFAVFGLIACLCFYFMRRKASLAVFVFAVTGCFLQAVRCALKSPYLLQDRTSGWLFGGECGILLVFVTLAWIMISKGPHYEEILASIHEDLGFKPPPADPETRPKQPRFSLFRV